MRASPGQPYPLGATWTDEAWNAPFIRSLDVLTLLMPSATSTSAGRQVAGHPLLILLNADFERVPFVQPAEGHGRQWIRMLDTVETAAPEVRYLGATKYPLQGRTVVLFRLEGHGRIAGRPTTKCASGWGSR